MMIKSIGKERLAPEKTIKIADYSLNDPAPELDWESKLLLKSDFSYCRSHFSYDGSHPAR